MLTCREIDTALARYVEAQSDEGERGRVDEHLRVCARCRAAAARERTAHQLLCARREELRGAPPQALRERCAAQQQRATAPVARPPTHRPWVPLSLAATLVIGAGLFVLFGMGSGVETYAAQLAADHIKCFRFPPGATELDPVRLGEIWQGNYGWPLRVAPGSETEDLELVGMRRCASTRGRVAHLLYRWRGEPLSVYVLNARVEGAADSSMGESAHELVERLGEREIIWSDGNRTYAVVGDAPIPELQRVAQYVRKRVE